MELTTQQRGLITEKEVELFFNKLGYMVSIPTYYHSRYDLVVDINNKLYKIQVKTANITKANTGIIIPTCSCGRNNEGSHKKPYLKEEVDFFATIWNNQCYLFPIEICKGVEKTFTFEKYKNEQIAWLNDYAGEKVIQRLLCNEKIEIINKPIQQYTKEGQFVNSYISTVEAVKAVKETDNPSRDSAHISDVINGKRKSAYGYIWKRV